MFKESREKPRFWIQTDWIFISMTGHKTLVSVGIPKYATINNLIVVFMKIITMHVNT